MATNYSTLYDYYTKSLGQALPSLSERAKLYESKGLGSAASYAGTAEQNTSLLGKLQAPAPVPAVVPAPTPVPAPAQIQGAPEGYVPPAAYNNPNYNYNYGAFVPKPVGAPQQQQTPTSFTSVSSPAPAPTTTAVSGATPTLPTPQASSTTDSYFASLTASLEATRKSLEDSYKKLTKI